jgi:hypothetical protein
VKDDHHRITKPRNQYVQPKRIAPNLRYPGDDAVRAKAEELKNDLHKLAKHYSIAKETARRWLIRSGVISKPGASPVEDAGGMFHVTRSVMGRRHNGDLDAIRAEVERSTVRELSERYAVSGGTVSGWVFKLGVQAAKLCGRCRGRRLATQMARRTDGFASNICQQCEDAQAVRDRERMRKHRGKQAEVQARKEEELQEAYANADIAVMALRWKMSSQTGYYNQYAERSKS